jgi:hypothetical protein
VICGPGLVNIYQFTHDAFGSRTYITPAAFVPARTCAGVGAWTIRRICPARSRARSRAAARSAWRR